MAARSDLPRLAGARPSYFNSVASTFGVIGAAAAFAAATYIPAVATAVTGIAGATLAAPLAAAIGVGLAATTLGAVIGKTKMQNELINGRVVREPSFLNKGLMNGLFLGGAVALGIMAAPALLPAAAVASIPTVLTGAGALAAIAAVPAALGSLMSRSTQTKETVAAVRQAELITVTRQAESAKAKGLGPDMARAASVTPEEAAMLEARMKNGPAQGKSFAEQVLASREAAQGELARS